MQIKSTFTTLASVTLAVLAGCEVPSHELGDSPPSRPSNLVQVPPTQQPVAQFISDFDGLWVGEAEDPFSLAIDADAYHFPSGSTRILLDLNAAAPGQRTITFGQGPELPPPTDPDVMYPPGAESYVRVGYTLEPWEGHAYSLYDGGTRLDDLYALAPDSFGTLEEAALSQRLDEEGRVIDGRLRLPYLTYDLFRPWCELQPLDSGCNPNNLDNSVGGFSEDEAGHCTDLAGDPVDCGKALLCQNICPGMSAPPVAEISLQLTSEGLIGLFSGEAYFRNERGFQTPLGSVRFHRADAAE
jgi:hypothetical protein